MTNIYFPEEKVQKNDLYFICYMIERVARNLHQRNKYVVNTIGKKNSRSYTNGKSISKTYFRYCFT